MKLLVVLLAASLVAADSKCKTVPTSVPLPPSVATQIDKASSEVADIATVGTIISTAELASLTLSHAESVIESYVHSYDSLVNKLESYYASPSAIAPSELKTITCITTQHSTLAKAVSEIVSFELSHASFATAQDAIQSVEKTQANILTYLSEYTDIVSPSVSTATLLLAEATLTSPSILATVISIYTADASYPSVISALDTLSCELYTLPSSVVQQVLTVIASPCIAPPSVLASIASCYPDAYSALSYVTQFTKSHGSVVSAIINFLSAAASVASLDDAAHVVITQQMPTLTYQLSVVTQATYSWPSFKTDVQIVSAITATSLTLSCALHTIESSFYESPSVASNIYDAIVSPSCVRSPQKVSDEEASHQSLVVALDDLVSWEQAHSSYSCTLSGIMSKLTSAFKTRRTLLTAASYISAAASPSVASASVAISLLKTIESDVTTVLAEITYITKADPRVSCAESKIESYAERYPTVVKDLWHVVTASVPYTMVSYYENMEASYPSLVSAMTSVYRAESSDPSMVSAETSFISAATLDSSIMSQYSAFSQATSVNYWAYSYQSF